MKIPVFSIQINKQNKTFNQFKQFINLLQIIQLTSIPWKSSEKLWFSNDFFG